MIYSLYYRNYFSYFWDLGTKMVHTFTHTCELQLETWFPEAVKACLTTRWLHLKYTHYFKLPITLETADIFADQFLLNSMQSISTFYPT